MKQTVRDVDFLESEPIVIVDRVYWPDGTLMTNAGSGVYGVTSVVYRMYDLDGADPTTVLYSSGSIAHPSFASLQTDGYWTRDNTGYNIRFTVPFSAFEARGGHRYKIELNFTLHASNTFGAAWTTYVATCSRELVTV